MKNVLQLLLLILYFGLLQNLEAQGIYTYEKYNIQYGYQNNFNYMFCPGELQFIDRYQPLNRIYASKKHLVTTEVFPLNKEHPIEPEEFLKIWLSEDEDVLKPISLKLQIKKTYGDKEFYFVEVPSKYKAPMRAGLYVGNDDVMVMSIVNIDNSYFEKPDEGDVLYTFSRRNTLEDPKLGFKTFLPSFFEVKRMENGGLMAFFNPTIDSVFEVNLTINHEACSALNVDSLKKYHEKAVAKKGGNLEIQSMHEYDWFRAKSIYPIDAKNSIYQIEMYSYEFSKDRGEMRIAHYKNSFEMHFSPTAYKNAEKDLWVLHMQRGFSPDVYYKLLIEETLRLQFFTNP